ncbi:MAG: hypothetical protein L3I99_03950 [Sulfurimonas sp.]|nr:hypothetical protein [Sulfurimonas sp.]
MSKTIKWATLIIASIVFSIGFNGCGGAKFSPAVKKAFDTNQEMYTKRNMFITKFGRYGSKFIETTNYGNGHMIPVNTKVKFKDVNNRQISFTLDGNLVMLQNIPKYSGTTIEQMVNRYFSSKKVDLSKFTKLEREAITSNLLASKVVVGMSKEAVLVSRGYPPTHATMSPKSNAWKFWESKFDTRLIEFKDNKVVSIIE